MPRKKQEELEVQDQEVLEPQPMSDEDYLAFCQDKAADANLTAEERLFAMREIGRLNAKGVL